MLKIRTKSSFKKDLKRAAKNNRHNTKLLKELIDKHLIITGTVPSQYKPHLLQGNWQPHMECHIQPDFLLIWDVDWEAEELILVRCGSHSELFG
ncbi:type II toxin-antitoxin system YafQ family toxin [Thalassotalea sp. LPB0316]|uniref:type II toxin-antitoxin system YafQ family toxin n=1 Tax=Thalassotalea sp. LPB0316 TaxID=2769490 RepID=UPI00186612EF|nr:type II toxin-antitoxin system YafQ family toxin [Thalassotalea sp. LPB0316]